MSWTARAGRGPPALARAVRHAVRAGAHAPAADRARQPAAARSGRSTWSAPTARARRCAWPRRSSTRTASVPVRTCRRTSPRFAERIRIGDADLAPDAFGAAVERAAAAAAKVDRTLSGGERVTQFELLTAAAFSELAERGVEVGGGRGRPRRPPRRHQRARRAGRGAHQRRPRAHPLARPDDRRHRAARSSRSCAPGSTLVRRASSTRRPRRRWPTRSTPAWCARTAATCAPLTGFQCEQLRGRPTTAAAAFLAGALDEAAVRRAAPRSRVPGRFQIDRRGPADHLRRRPQPVRGGRARRGAAATPCGDRPLVAVLSVLDDKDAAGDAARARAARRRRRLHRQPQPTRAPPGDARARCRSQLGGPPGEIEANPRSAVERARALAGEDGAVVATGSIYLVADLLSEPGRRRASAL